MTYTLTLPHTLYIGDVQLNLMDNDTSRVTMPNSPSSYHTPTTREPMEKPNPIYIVLQHSKSAGNSKLLPCSKVAGVFQARGEAVKYVHDLKDKQQPVVRKENGEAAARPEFWCTSSEPDEEGGFQYISTYGEEFFVWVEEHEIQKEGGDGGGDVVGK